MGLAGSILLCSIPTHTRGLFRSCSFLFHAFGALILIRSVLVHAGPVAVLDVSFRARSKLESIPNDLFLSVPGLCKAPFRWASQNCVRSSWIWKVFLALGKVLAADLVELLVRSVAHPRVLLTLVSHSSLWRAPTP